MIRTSTITAEDRGVKLSIKIRMATTRRTGLTRDEVNSIQTQAVRRVAETIRGLHYADFGVENTTVTL